MRALLLVAVMPLPFFFAALSFSRKGKVGRSFFWADTLFANEVLVATTFSSVSAISSNHSFTAMNVLASAVIAPERLLRYPSRESIICLPCATADWTGKVPRLSRELVTDVPAVVPASLQKGCLDSPWTLSVRVLAALASENLVFHASHVRAV